MGREEKRLRERAARQLEKRLRRKPTEEEIDQAMDALREARDRIARRETKR